jgi:hypothetical protein
MNAQRIATLEKEKMRDFAIAKFAGTLPLSLTRPHIPLFNFFESLYSTAY